MKRGYQVALAAMLAFVCVPAVAAPGIDLDAFVKKDTFVDIKLSPTGEYYAATVPLEDQMGLAIIRVADAQMSTALRLGKNTHFADFDWVSDERVVLSVAEKFGMMDAPQLTGELYALDADGSDKQLLIGQRVAGAGTGTRIQTQRADRVAAFLIDPLLEDPRYSLVSTERFALDPFTRAERLDIYTGRRVVAAVAPIRNARFTTDNTGVVRFAHGAGHDIVNKLYYRAGDGAEWVLLNDESASGHAEWPVGFSADNRTAYLTVEQASGPGRIVAYDIASGERTTVLADETGDPAVILHAPGTQVPVGALFLDGKPRTAFFDPQSADARLYRSLEAAFDGHAVYITSSTSDGRKVLLQTWSDRNPGDFYIYDTVDKKAAHVVARRQWFDPAQMAERRPVSLQARDGLELQGFVTLPAGSNGRNLPMVVLPHGGPFGIFDTWQFDTESQMLASAGYAVLQVNFRGSGSRGRAFEHAGAREWGGRMQDDVTDATRWAIAQGIADAGRICIYGSSYGGYAALMGAAREPALYRCAAGNVGVYDLPTMHTHGDIQQRGSGTTYLREWIGERDALGAVSPTRMADRIRIPVFLAAGGKDERAPIEHTRMMERALASAGVPVETAYFPTEGHGYYDDANRREYYTRLLAFLGRHLGGKATAAN
ncbi:S9 family peptidase [Luteimonas sp. MC1895]|uniref:alpha/beta hydrolase family protein n=1 Tax=Luteimonas sp. MC1895 TaxID=2819513 RepID=UPI0018F10704|nr:S9 family peptidase [Luteimonas sp. MC1895]MBJ6978751.1 S9 family peptidase [Luteimonas sp. MC1895]